MILGLSPRFIKRPLAFKYPRREALVALSLVVLLGVVLWQVYSHLAIALPAAANSFTFDPIQLIYLIIVAVVVAAPFAAALLARGQPWRSAGLGRQTLRPSLQLGLALAVISIFLRGKVYALLDGITISEIYLLVGILALGFAEEFAFRGYVQPRLSAWWGATVGWIATALLFTLWRLPAQILVFQQKDPTTLGLSLLDLFVFALIQGWIIRKSGNVIAPAIFNGIHSWVMFI